MTKLITRIVSLLLALGLSACSTVDKWSGDENPDPFPQAPPVIAPARVKVADTATFSVNFPDFQPPIDTVYDWDFGDAAKQRYYTGKDKPVVDGVAFLDLPLDQDGNVMEEKQVHGTLTLRLGTTDKARTHVYGFDYTVALFGPSDLANIEFAGISPTRVKPGMDVTFNALVAKGKPVRYDWEFGLLGTPNPGTGQSFKLTIPADRHGSYPVSVTAYDAAGNPKLFETNVFIDNDVLPYHVLQAAPGRVKADTEYAFSFVLEYGAPTKYFWDFGDLGTPSTETVQSPKVKIAKGANGVYPIQLYLGNSEGFLPVVSDAPLQVEVVAEDPVTPEAQEVGPHAVVRGKTYTFGYLPGAGTANAWFWDFGDWVDLSSSPTGQTASVTIRSDAALGTHSGTLTLLGPNPVTGQPPLSSVKEFSVTVQDSETAPVSILAVSPTAVIEDSEATFALILNSGSPSAMLWDFGTLGTYVDGTSSGSTNPKLRINPLAAIAANPVPCTVTITTASGNEVFPFTVDVSSATDQVVVVLPLSVVAGQTQSFTAQLVPAASGVTYLWNFGTLGTVDATNHAGTATPKVTIAAAQPGDPDPKPVDITLTVTSSLGVWTEPVTVMVYTTP